ncbi:J domain-containing protein [Saccharibacillus qingshengii]|uniref:J domain-containing protein n=1 Tax=Saccharibacillus qingshengii TaxID=1763540 RepID=UPI001553F01D|nr:tetratricopeptide repeat protein [Saccharibacillus qingshengii]
MNIWSMLGIEPTSEIKAIKRAYARRLKECHPEENPEGFQRIRQSYEMALEEAKRLAEPGGSASLSKAELQGLRNPEPAAAETGPESPVMLFMRRCEDIYTEIEKRIDPDTWQELLDDELFWPIEVRERIGRDLFGFLLKHPFLPQSVLHLLDRHFEWTARERRLGDEYEQAEVGLFMERFNSFWELRYDRLVAEEPYDYDAFLRFREQAHYALVLNDLDLAEKALKGAALLNNREPDCLRLIALFYMRKEEMRSALQVLDQWVKEEPEEPEARLMRGEALRRDGNPTLALTEYEQLLKRLPGSIHALSGIAACKEELDLPWEAKKVYEELCARYPEDLEAQIRLLMLNDRLAGNLTPNAQPDRSEIYTLAELYLDTGREKECAEMLLEAESGQTLSAELNFLLGKALGKLERYAESEERLTRAIRQTESQPPKQADILKLRGLIRIALERFEEARLDLRQVLLLKPSDPEALYWFGESLRMEGNYEEALQLLNHALELSSQWYYHSARGDCFYSLRRYPEALLDYLRVIQYDRTLKEPWFRVGYCFLRIGDYAHGLEYLNEAKERGFPEAVLLLMAEAHFRAGEFEQAVSMVGRYNRERPKEYYGRIVEGDMYRSSGRGAEALTCYREAERIAPLEYLPARLAAEMLLRANRAAEAQQSLAALMQRHPARGWAYLQQIRLLISEQRWEEAESSIVRYTDQIDPKEQDPLILLYGGYILFRLDQYEQAAEFFEAACQVGLQHEAAEYLIRCWVAMGRYEQAEELAVEAASSGGERPMLTEIARVLQQYSSRRWKLLRRTRGPELPDVEAQPALPEPAGEPLPEIHGF